MGNCLEPLPQDPFLGPAGKREKRGISMAEWRRKLRIAPGRLRAGWIDSDHAPFPRPRSSALAVASPAAPRVARAQRPGGPGGRPHPSCPGSACGGGGVGPGDRGPAAADGGRPQRAVRAAGECGAAGRWGGGCTPRQMCCSCWPSAREVAPGSSRWGCGGRNRLDAGIRCGPDQDLPQAGSGKAARSPRSRGLRAALRAAAPISRAIYSR